MEDILVKTDVTAHDAYDVELLFLCLGDWLEINKRQACPRSPVPDSI